MAIELNHTIVHSRNAREAAAFTAEILGLAAPETFYHFLVVRTANGVSLDFLDHPGEVTLQHYAFLVSEGEFDAILGRIQARGLPYWADPAGRQPGKINTLDGGRGVYFRDPTGHYLEILTRPYGSGGTVV